MRLTVRIKRTESNPDVPLPRYATSGASGMDIHAAVDREVTLEPGERASIPAGFIMSIPPGYEAQIRPRSGLAMRHGITVTNAPGTIDSDYRGEICVLLINLGRESFRITRGDRIAQMVFKKVAGARLEETDALDETPRAAGGFGHTGVSAGSSHPAAHK